MVSHIQRREIIALEQWFVPRFLTDEQKQRISDAVRPYHVTFDLIVYNDAEPLNFSVYIVDALQKGGWTQVDFQGNPPQTFSRPGAPAFGVSQTAGIGVVYDGSRIAEFNEAASTLATVLLKEGFQAHAGPFPLAMATNANVIHVMVGRKL